MAARKKAQHLRTMGCFTNVFCDRLKSAKSNILQMSRSRSINVILCRAMGAGQGRHQGGLWEGEGTQDMR